MHGFPAALRHRALGFASPPRLVLLALRSAGKGIVIRRDCNILRREGAGSGEKHLIFQSTAQIDLCRCCCFFLPSERLPVFVACSLCRSPRILDAPVHPTPPTPPPFLTPTLLSSTLITQLLLGNVVPAGPSISRVATATEGMIQTW